MAITRLLQYGSQGDDVKKLQQTLNTKGYNLGVDGIFGNQTLSAVKNFQQKNGLTVDGIVGNNTMTALKDGGGGSTTTSNKAVAAPTASPLPTAPTYDTTLWDDTDKGKVALGEYNAAKDAVANYGDFKYGNQAQLDAIMNDILNRKPFSYNFNEDAFYQMYKDKAGQQAKMAMADTMGQAAAMTGGFGNSYAQSVGQQAYAKEMQNLNDKIPELYQMAYDRYHQEGQDLYNQYGLLADDRSTEYGMWGDKYNKLMDALGIARGDYYDGADMFHSEQSNKNNIAGQTFNDAMSLWQANTDQAWKQAQWDEDARRYAEEVAYQKERDKIADSQWQKQYDATYGKTTGGSVGTGSGSGNRGSSGGSGGSGSSGSGNGSSGGSGNNNTGNGNSGNTNTSSVPDSIKNKASSFTNNDALNDYLTKQYQAGKITKEQMGQLYLENEVSSLSNRNWTAGKDGGVNWLWGIDNNATVKDQYGNEYRLDKLVDALVAEGMSKKDAKDYVKKLQGKLGL